MSKSNSKVNFSELAEELGGFGLYQKYVYFLSCLTAFMPAMFVVNIILMAKTLDHRCLIPQCESDGNATYQEDFLNFTTHFNETKKSWEKCSRFKTIDTRDMSCDPLNFNPFLEKNCTEFVHDTSVLKTTTVTEFELVCDRSWMKPIGSSAYMIGSFFGAFILGNLADQIGRKKGFLVSLSIMCIGGLLGSFSYNYYMFVATRIITGLGGAPLYAISFVLILEFVPMKYRNFCGILLGIPFALGEAFVALLSYFFRNWRWLNGACSITPLILFSYYWIMPESFRWSVSQGRIDEAKATIKKIEKWNKVKVSKHLLDAMNSKNSLEKVDNNEELEVVSRSPLDLLRYPNLRKRTLALMFCWIVVTLDYYGLSINSADLGGNLFVNFVAVMLIEIPSCVFAYLILDRIGRKWSLSLTYLIGGVGCLVSAGLPSTNTMSIIVMSMIGKFGVTAAFAIIFVYTAEVFPTSMRSLGIGTCSMTARLGGIIAPFIADLDKIFVPLPPLIFGILGVAAAIVMIFLPETLGCELPQTIEESESFGIDQSILQFPCCGRKKTIDLPLTPEVKQAFADVVSKY